MRTNTRPPREERAETRVPGHVRSRSAKVPDSARSLFRSSKLYLRTALNNHFTTRAIRLSAQNRHSFEMKRLRKHVDHMQLHQVVSGLNQRLQISCQGYGIAGDVDDLRC